MYIFFALPILTGCKEKKSAGAMGGMPTPEISVTKPIIKNVKISNINDSGYTVTCTVLSNNKITEVLFPTWTYKNEQDDLTEEQKRVLMHLSNMLI